VNAPILASRDWRAVGGPLELPPQVLALAPREREIATVVYRLRSARAKEIEDHFAGELANASIRSMLMRLCKKRILKRRRITVSKPGARRIAYLYLPAIGADTVREGALRQVAMDHFDGSLSEMANLALNLLEGTSRSIKA
jgi:predicted transcriptional regulator